MDSRGDTLIKVWRLVNDKFAALKPRRVTWPRVRRKRDVETSAPIRYTTRPYIKITPAVDDFLAREAEARSLDMSRLVQLLVLGKIRIRPTPAPSLRGRLNKTFRMTITDRQKKAIVKLMQERQTKYPSLMTFALAAALSLEVINPEAPVLLTIQEEWMLRRVDYARVLATRYCPTPAVPLELDRAYDAVRLRFELHGLQPKDVEKSNQLINLLRILVDEISLDIYPPAIDELWTQVVAVSAGMGLPK
jgi:hypothetical protein